MRSTSICSHGNHQPNRSPDHTRETADQGIWQHTLCWTNEGVIFKGSSIIVGPFLNGILQKLQIYNRRAYHVPPVAHFTLVIGVSALTLLDPLNQPLRLAHKMIQILWISTSGPSGWMLVGSRLATWFTQGLPAYMLIYIPVATQGAVTSPYPREISCKYWPRKHQLINFHNSQVPTPPWPNPFPEARRVAAVGATALALAAPAA